MIVSTKTNSTVEFKPMAIPKKYRIIGFFFFRGVPKSSSLEDTQDLLSMRWSLSQLESDIHGGVLHPGTVIVNPKGKMFIVLKEKTGLKLKKFNLDLGDKNDPITNYFNP